MHTCILDNEGSECLVAPQLPLALCGDQPGHTECSCVNFTGGHKHMVHTVISIVSSLAYVVCVYNHAHSHLAGNHSVNMKLHAFFNCIFQSHISKCFITIAIWGGIIMQM